MGRVGIFVHCLVSSLSLSLFPSLSTFVTYLGVLENIQMSYSAEDSVSPSSRESDDEASQDLPLARQGAQRRTSLSKFKNISSHGVLEYQPLKVFVDNTATESASRFIAGKRKLFHAHKPSQRKARTESYEAIRASLLKQRSELDRAESVVEDVFTDATGSEGGRLVPGAGGLRLDSVFNTDEVSYNVEDDKDMDEKFWESIAVLSSSKALLREPSSPRETSGLNDVGEKDGEPSVVSSSEPVQSHPSTLAARGDVAEKVKCKKHLIEVAKAMSAKAKMSASEELKIDQV